MPLLRIEHLVLGVHEKATFVVVGQDQIYVHVEPLKELADAMLILHLVEAPTPTSPKAA
jgi:hypothetical protein